MKRIMLTLFCLAFGMVATAQAHSVWINNFFADTHFPPHSMVSIGWGHTMPMDDIPNSPNGRVILEKFEVVTPGMERVQLRKPSAEESKPSMKSEPFDVFEGDLAVQKVAFKKETKPGVYQFNAVTAPTFYNQYIDKKGRQRLALKPRDQVKDIDKLLMSVKFQSFSKSLSCIGEWQQPKPLGHTLEIVPLTDLTDVREGDLVEVQVTFNGKPISASAKSMDFITAHGPGFGQSDHFALMSYVMNGKAQFRVQASGQWMISINHKEDVTEDGPLKALYGKADQVYTAASLTFTVK